MTTHTPLNPAAQVVLDAFVDAACGSTYEMYHGLAAALRAAASQLTSAKAIGTLRFIAAELEAHQ